MSHPTHVASFMLVCPLCQSKTDYVVLDPEGPIIIDDILCGDCFDVDNSEYEESEESTVEFVEGDTELNPIVLD